MAKLQAYLAMRVALTKSQIIFLVGALRIAKDEFARLKAIDNEFSKSMGNFDFGEIYQELITLVEPVLVKGTVILVIGEDI